MNPSPWLEAQRRALEATVELGPAVDLACGRGRNALAAASWGVPVIGVDRNAEWLAELRAAAERLPVAVVRADLESGPEVPFRPGACGAILVFRFLYRPLLRRLAELLAPGGVLIYETFTLDQRKLGYGPRNADFLLEPGELAASLPGLELEAHWEGISEIGSRPEAVARVLARRGR